MSNGTYQIDCLVDDRQQQQQQREIVHIALTLLVSFAERLDSLLSTLASTSFRGDDDDESGNMTLPLRHPFMALVAGPTGCGKTRFVFRLIEHARVMVDPPPRRVVYCYGKYQQLFSKYPRVTFH